MHRLNGDQKKWSLCFPSDSEGGHDTVAGYGPKTNSLFFELGKHENLNTATLWNCKYQVYCGLIIMFNYTFPFPIAEGEKKNT